MTLQQKFLLVVSMLGVALLGSLGAVWWSFSLLHREITAPFADTTRVLDALREIKRNTEEQGKIIHTNGVDPAELMEPPIPHDPRHAPPHDPAGVRGPWGAPRFFQPGPEALALYRALVTSSAGVLEQIGAEDALTARIGVSTWRNLQDRVAATGTLAEKWFAGDAGGQLDAARECYTIHELIERTEKQILAGAKSSLSYGEVVRSRLLVWLRAVSAVGLLGGVLAVALLRRWVQKPVRALREAAARIAQGDLEHRVPVLQKDELGLLSAEINHMAGMVQVMQDERIGRERLAAVGEMVRRIVHNVRNPLAGIRGLAEVTRMDFDKASPNRESMDLIVSTVDTFERWLSELLDTTSPTKVEPRPTPVERWISELVDVHRPQAAARSIDLQLEVSRSPESAVFDPKHLDHAVSALVSNAVEATPVGGQVWVSVRAADAADNGSVRDWEVEVVDSGPGVPAEVLSRIFEPHFTTKRHGNGLGLAMARQVAFEHAGRISVRNGDPAHPERCGARFVMRLPLDPSTTRRNPNKDRSTRM